MSIYLFADFFQVLISSEWRRKKVAGEWQKGECEVWW